MAITPGGSLNSVPAPQKQTLNTNYIDFTSASGNNWAQQYLPDLMEKEAEVFGPRTISGFLSQVGAEEAMTSDQVVWSEQGRLHLSYTGKVASGGGATVNSTTSSQITIQKDIDGIAISSDGHGIRVNDLVIVSDSVNGIVKCLVVTVSATTIDVLPYDAGAATLSAQTTDNLTTILVFGSEFGKGTKYMKGGATIAAGNETDSRGAVEPRFKSFTNKPIIMKDYYEVSGSDASRIGWVEVSAENGQSGYLWYLKAEADT